MPELPEVETTLRALHPVVKGRRIEGLVLRRRDLRWPVSPELPDVVVGQQIKDVWRRGKYLLVSVGEGTVLVHLGMSGSIRILRPSIPQAPAQIHDHVDLLLTDGTVLRYTDPRRFGAWLWTREPVAVHPLLKGLGPEPWDEALTPEYLHALASNRRAPVKAFIMDNSVLVGVGNIYATEALFMAGIHPARAAGRVSMARMAVLLAAIRDVLSRAIAVGGSTLKDFSSGEGRPGYFSQQLQVYGRAGMSCFACGTQLKSMQTGGRASAFCPQCQR